MREKPHELSSIKKVIGVVSGKGGVGKSMTSAMLAVLLNRRGYHTAVLDADVTGPSIPKLFGLHGRAAATEQGIIPVRTRTGIDVMSVNLLLENETDPVVWRGPVIAGAVKQFWQDVIWKDCLLYTSTGTSPLATASRQAMASISATAVCTYKSVMAIRRHSCRVE